MPDEIIIKLSKNKIIMLVLISVAFILCGFWLLNLNPEQAQFSQRIIDPSLLSTIAFGCIGFFSLCGVFGVIKLFDKKPGLILNSTGIVDNSSAVSAGFIPWHEIQGFREFEMSGQKLLIVLVSEPKKYINRGNSMRRALNKAMTYPPTLEP